MITKWIWVVEKAFTIPPITNFIREKNEITLTPKQKNAFVLLDETNENKKINKKKTKNERFNDRNN